MQLKRLGLGIRFDFLNMVPNAEVERLVFEEIFSVLTLGDVKGLQVFGGVDPTSPEENVYLAVLMGGKLKTMRRIYTALCDDAAIGMYLCHTQPFLENNRLEHIEGLTCFGEIGKDGFAHGGERPLPAQVSKKRGKRRNVGRGIHILLAPSDMGPVSALDAVKRLTLMARRYFPGVRILPFPITPLGGGMQSLVRAAGGSLHRARVSVPESRDVPYGVLRGRTAVIEALPGDSYPTGEVVRRALDEGLKEFYVFPAAFTDEGMGCARALGARFYDAAGVELHAGVPARVDTEFMHPLLSRARFILMQSAGESLGERLTPLLRLKTRDAADAMLDAADFERLLTGKALVVTGGEDVTDAASLGRRTLEAIAPRCANFQVPIVVLSCSGWGDPTLYARGGTGMGVVKVPLQTDMTPEVAGEVFDDTADRLFRFIRLGRDVEKIGAPKREKRRWRRLPDALRARITRKYRDEDEEES